MHFGKFLLFTFLGSIPWNYALTFAGFALGDNWATILGVTRYIDIIIVVAVLALIIWFIVYRIRRMRKEKNAGIAAGK